MSSGPCAVEGCPREKKKRGHCGLHYQRLTSHGDATATQHEDVSTAAERRCRFCSRDISHKRSNAVWCDRSCKYWAYVWSDRQGVSSNPSSVKIPGAVIDKILSCGQCSYCGELGEVELDHIIPLARGGAHREGNITPACHSCNSSKRSMLLIEWRVSALRGRG